MPENGSRHRNKIATIVFLVALISILHYTTPLHLSLSHELFARFYYIPILLAGFWYGRAGGIFAALVASVLYLPHIWAGWGEGGPVFWDQILVVILFNIIGPTVGILTDMERRQRARKEFISNTFGRYVDQDVAKRLMSRPEASRLGGEKREVAILIADIRDFTSASEVLSPEATIKVLNLYFSKMIGIIQRHAGIVVDFIGDGMLVFFDPLDGPVAPVVDNAVRCALEMQGEMGNLNSEMRKQGLPELGMGIGLNAGQVVVGNIGSETRVKYGIVGLAVNVTERIQEMAGGGEVVISDPALRYGVDRWVVSRSFNASLQGLQDDVRLHIVGRIKEQGPPQSAG